MPNDLGLPEFDPNPTRARTVAGLYREAGTGLNSPGAKHIGSPELARCVLTDFTFAPQNLKFCPSTDLLEIGPG